MEKRHKPRPICNKSWHKLVWQRHTANKWSSCRTYFSQYSLFLLPRLIGCGSLQWLLFTCDWFYTKLPFNCWIDFLFKKKPCVRCEMVIFCSKWFLSDSDRVFISSKNDELSNFSSLFFAIKGNLYPFRSSSIFPSQNSSKYRFRGLSVTS